MQVQRRWRWGAVVVAGAMALGACGGDDEDEGGGGATTTASGGATTTAPSGGGGGGGGGGGSDVFAIPVGQQCEDGLAIGFFGALTGDAANLGINIKNGAELYFDQFNEANPDCQIELKEYDSQGSAEQAPGLAEQAIRDDEVIGIIGPAFSGESEAANPLFDRAGLPIITPSATRPSLAENGWKVFHRALGNDASQGPAIANYIRDELRPASAFVIDDGSPYGQGLAGFVNDTLGDVVKGTDTVAQGQTDFSGTVTKVVDAEPDVVFFGGYYAEAGLLAKQLRDAGVEAALVYGDGVKDPGYIDGAGSAAEGSYVSCPCAPGEDFPGFFDAYEEAFDTPAGTYSAEAYDAAGVFADAIVNGATTREAVLDHLSEVEYRGITKVLQFDEDGEPGGDLTIYMFQVEDGEIVSLGPIS